MVSDAPPDSIAISIRNVSKKFVLETNRASSMKEALLRRKDDSHKDFWALRDVSFDVPKGSFFGIIGHNGSGKSTLLRLMAGIHKPTEGTIHCNGRISALLELGSGFHPDLTGRENIFLNGAMLGLRKQQMNAAIEEIIDFSGIGDFIDSPVKVYSSGMHVRLGFAVAVHVDPEILLVDEVLAVGDEAFQRKCLDHIDTLRRKGVTIILVAHSPHLMQTMCDQVAWLDHGELQILGDPSDAVGGYIHKVNTEESIRLAKEQSQQAALVSDSASGEQPNDADPTDLPEDDPDRRGSGEIRVLRLEYLDSREEPASAGRSGDPLTIRIWFESTETIDSPTFGIGFYAEDVHVAAIDDKIFGVHQPVIEPGEGFVDVVFGRLTLLAGTYYLSTAIHSSNQMHCYDSWHLAHKFVIQPGSSNQHNALVELDADFMRAKQQ